mmetsp:Transcript_3962/g.11027  ORF Transcript_3962/g.11027 Transcript_3962/m.11027 type:complete len:419 (+) Transcript_3962:1448-2704(+)
MQASLAFTTCWSCSHSASASSAPSNPTALRSRCWAIRDRLPASSSRSMALSGMYRSAMYRDESFTAASTASEVYRQWWNFSYRSCSPRRICQHSSSEGSLIITGWNRRSSAASFSMYLRCSSTVVAPMHWSSPRASAGFSRLEMSKPPAPPPRPTDPAPTRVCTSSMTRMTSPPSLTSRISPVTRDSSSPRSLAPAMSRPTSTAMMRLEHRNSGRGSPSTLVFCTTHCARPSATAVLPTPGSPSRMGLFLVRRARIWMTRATSSSRPITGSRRPSRASAHRSRQNSSRTPCCCSLPLAPAPAPAPLFPPPRPGAEPSPTLCFLSLRSASSRRASASTLSACSTRGTSEAGAATSASTRCSGAMKLCPSWLDSCSAASKACFAAMLNGISWPALRLRCFAGPWISPTASRARSSVAPVR